MTLCVARLSAPEATRIARGRGGEGMLAFVPCPELQFRAALHPSGLSCGHFVHARARGRQAARAPAGSRVAEPRCCAPDAQSRRACGACSAGSPVRGPPALLCVRARLERAGSLHRKGTPLRGVLRRALPAAAARTAQRAALARAAPGLAPRPQASGQLQASFKRPHTCPPRGAASPGALDRRGERHSPALRRSLRRRRPGAQPRALKVRGGVCAAHQGAGSVGLLAAPSSKSKHVGSTGL